MDHAIDPGPIPAPRGLEKEEPELAQEDDIPADDGTPRAADEPEKDKEDRPLRHVERE